MKMPSIFLCVILLACCSHFPAITAFHGRAQGGKRWGVILAGAKGYYNYFSQANACHGYHVLRNGGIPAENIIHLNYDDAANSEHNPVKNNLINTLNGSNVYEGCLIDYRGSDVTPEVFINVLTGNKTAVEMLTGKTGKVLESGPDDEVFLYMTDHGGMGQFDFPDGSLPAKNFSKALQTMYRQKMYSQMVVFMDSCYSGSMFYGFLPKDMNIYAVTSTNPEEVGYLNCWENTQRYIFLSSLFSYTWLFTTDQLDRDKESFSKLYETSYQACTNYSIGVSHPQQYGNTSFNKYFLNRFIGDDKGTNKEHICKSLGAFDENTLTMLAKEFDFPFEDDVLSSHFLQRPPIDMGGIATLIRRLMSKTLTHSDRASLKAQLSYSSSIKIMANEMVKAIERNVLQRIDNSPLRMKNFEWTEVLDCHSQAMERIRSLCPILQPQQFPFINRNFRSLINLCKVASSKIVMSAVATSTTKHCRIL